MATDTKTTAERVKILKTLSKELLNIAHSCETVQKYHDNTTDYISRNENVNSSMASIKTAIEAVCSALTDLASSENMAFQFEWVSGRGNLVNINVSSSLGEVHLSSKLVGDIPSSMIYALSAGDVVSFQGSAVNSSYYQVVSVANHAVAYVSGLHGNESLLSRVIKQMG